MENNLKTKKCPYCGREIMASAKKCRYCGKWLSGNDEQMMPCPICGEMIDKTTNICPYCKEPVGKYVSKEKAIGVIAEKVFAAKEKVQTPPEPKKEETPKPASPVVVEPSKEAPFSNPEHLNFWSSIKKCYRKFAIFEGRATRSEFWYFYLFATIVGSLVSAIYSVLLFGMDFSESSIMIGLVLLMVYCLAITLPICSAATRRLHDAGKSGWNWFFALIPIVGVFILLYFLIKDSDNDNAYSLNPKKSADTAAISATTRDKVVAGILGAVIVFTFVLNIVVIHQTMSGFSSLGEESTENNATNAQASGDGEDESSDIKFGTYSGRVNGQPVSMTLEDNGDGTVTGTFQNDNNGFTLTCKGTINDGSLSLEGTSDDGLTFDYILTPETDNAGNTKLSGTFSMQNGDWIGIELEYQPNE